MSNRAKMKFYYDGVDLRKAILKHIECDGDYKKDGAKIQREIVDISRKERVVLVAITADSTYTRKMSVLKVIQKKLEIKLMGEVLCERQYQRKFSNVRVAAIHMFGNQMSEVVNILYKLGEGAFAVCVETDKMQILARTLIELFDGGVLAPKCLAECCNVSISYNASFFYACSGNDGDAIFLFLPI